jgi:hypothetical protein
MGPWEIVSETIVDTVVLLSVKARVASIAYQLVEKWGLAPAEP